MVRGGYRWGFGVWLGVWLAGLLGMLGVLGWVGDATAQQGGASGGAACGGDFSGEWDSSYGPMTLTQTGDKVTGTYALGAGGTVSGACAGGRLTFTYHEEPATDGEGWFELSKDGARFVGKWREDGKTQWADWKGARATPAPPFHGLFDTSYGRMRLTRTGDKVRGFYKGKTEGTVEGEVKGGKLTFAWREATTSGEGWFEQDGAGFKGQWRGDPASAWADWVGAPTTTTPGVRWLVIVEPHWEESLTENEYAFGDMLRAYFERVPSVRVRHRRVRTADDLSALAQDIALLAEPTALWLSGHGDEAGVTLEGAPIDDVILGPLLSLASNVFIVHFASCAVMGGDVPKRLRAALPKDRPLAISGYATPVDWSASAALEMLYLDLLLARGVPPADAFATIRAELRFAGDTPTPSSPFGALMLRLVE